MGDALEIAVTCALGCYQIVVASDCPHWLSLDSAPSPGSPAEENIYALESLTGYIVSGCWELRTEIPANIFPVSLRLD